MRARPPAPGASPEGATRSRLEAWPRWKRAGAGLLLALHALWAPVAAAGGQQEQVSDPADGQEAREQEPRPEDGTESTEEAQAPASVLEEEPSEEAEAELASDEGTEPRPGAGAFPGLFSVQVGTEIWGRRLRFSGARGGGLLNHLAPVVVSPRVRVELYPLRRWSEGLASRLSLEADFALAVGSQTRWEEGTAFPLEARRLDVGARLGFMRGSRLVVSPTLGLRHTRLGLGATRDGSRLEGLPGVTYESLRGGLALRLVSRRVLSLLAEVSYLYTLSRGGISSEAFFPGARASGLEGRGGLEYQAGGVMAVRLEAFFTRYALRMDVEPERVPFARGGVDQHAGASLGLRFSL